MVARSLLRTSHSARLRMISVAACLLALNIALAPGEALAQGRDAAGPAGIAAGLQLWLRADAGVFELGGLVETWADQSTNGRDAAQADPARRPAFVASNSDVNSQPTLRFECTEDSASPFGCHMGDALGFDGTFVASSDYTIFVVNGRDRFGFANFYLGGDGFSQNGNLALGYERVDLLRQAHFANDNDAVVEAYVGIEIWSIDTFRFDGEVGRQSYHNGTLGNADASGEPLFQWLDAHVGWFPALGDLFYFKGDIAEIIFYDRALSSSERTAVECELSSVYGLPLVGVDCDSDGDGVPDADDECPDSDLSPTVVIDGCDSEVDNVLLDDGCTISDVIADCADGARNHGQFVSCVSDLTIALRSDGIITGRERGAIQTCAALADIP